ncbi:MAG: bifunctional molybdenum cofactor biosynthesis protein MoaC/MoaB [Flammeovirgaceae bacterium]
MVDITHKSSTLRQAIAQAVVKVSKQETIDALVNKQVPKGDVFEMAKVAGLFGVKKTAELIPDCHPLPIEYTNIDYTINGLEVTIEMEVKTIYKTGVEVEAMHGASVVALTMYDMLKPIDKGVEIHSIKLVSKRGGKSDYRDKQTRKIIGAVVVASDSVSAGKKEDVAGKTIVKELVDMGVEVADYLIVSDDPTNMEETLLSLCEKKVDLIITTGGTGLSPRDHTPETVRKLIDQEVPGMMEAARKYGQERTPYAMLSRGIAGMRGDTLLITLPGSTRGAKETMDALFPAALHIFRVKDVLYRHGN